MKDNQFRKLSVNTAEVSCTFIRDDKEHEVSIYDLVVGNLTRVKIGMIIPADGLIVKQTVSKSTKAAKQAKATCKKGSLHSGNDKCNPFMLSGAKVEEGNSSMIVCVVGK